MGLTLPVSIYHEIKIIKTLLCWIVNIYHETEIIKTKLLNT